jgi:putative ABC transport system ATP-binding protein
MSQPPGRPALLSVKSLARLHVRATFALSHGECVALQGASGSGKTLLMRAIADLDPNEGAVKLDGTLRERMPAPEWRKQVTYLAAEPGWWTDIVKGHFEAWDAVEPLLDQLNLPPDCGNWNVARLSTGEKQRLALARVLMLQSRVLLLDEPTSGLDAASTASVEALIEKRRSTGTAVIWCTHDSGQVKRVASRLLFADRGQIDERSL